ncbi:hypothetical protein [Nocardia bovistercoris]|uniref:Uncharacterized protein n=1 Tax=Nocardia bovistercoris TaxID=2785916 RepID=A0A931IKB2_9NOCA|nr:hypothetical protein [Nocardia bovistercoris]MBH0781592.1 hypothetical protein [Nocardia bovistercoris]
MADDLPGFAIVVTDSCADAAAEVFGVGDRERAREWVLRVVAEEGEVAEALPPIFGQRDESGWYLVAENLLALPLASEVDRGGHRRWVATDCYGSSRQHVIDPYALTGAELIEQIAVTVQAVERFQRYGGGDSDPVVARRQLVDVLALSARADRTAPDWWRSPTAAEFYLSAGQDDSMCLPCRACDGVRPYTATTFMHRAADLFALRGIELGTRCRADPLRFPPGGPAEQRLFRLLAKDSRLSWHKPDHVPAEDRAEWWVSITPGLAASVAWEPHDPARPLVVLGLWDVRPRWRKLLGR